MPTPAPAATESALTDDHDRSTNFYNRFKGELLIVYFTKYWSLYELFRSTKNDFPLTYFSFFLDPKSRYVDPMNLPSQEEVQEKTISDSQDNNKQHKKQSRGWFSWLLGGGKDNLPDDDYKPVRGNTLPIE